MASLTSYGIFAFFVLSATITTILGLVEETTNSGLNDDDLNLLKAFIVNGQKVQFSIRVTGYIKT